MAIEVTPDHFTRLEQAVAEIASDGLHFLETEIAPDDLAKTAHVHAYRVDIYLLEGILDLHEPDSGRTQRLEAGSKAVVPAETLHSEYTPGGFRAAIGLSIEPAKAINAPAVPASPAQ